MLILSREEAGANPSWHWRWGIPWISHQCIAELSYREKQPFTLTFEPMVNLKPLDCGVEFPQHTHTKRGRGEHANSGFKSRIKIMLLKDTNKTIKTIVLLTQGICVFCLVWSVGASCDDSGRLKFDAVARELLSGPLSEDTRARHGILAPVEAPRTQLTVPLPTEGTVYQYRFIKEVGLTLSAVQLWALCCTSGVYHFRLNELLMEKCVCVWGGGGGGCLYYTYFFLYTIFVSITDNKPRGVFHEVSCFSLRHISPPALNLLPVNSIFITEDDEQSNVFTLKEKKHSPGTSWEWV